MKNLLILAVFLLCPLTALANEVPPIKAGLWEVTTSKAGQEGKSIKQCVNQSVLKELLESTRAHMGGTCSDMEMTKSGNTYKSSMRCDIMGSTMVSESEMTGDFQKSYSVTTKTQMTPPIMGMGNTQQDSTARYLGDCEEGMQPGDMIMADGKKVNSLQMMKSMPNMNEMMKNMPDMSKMQEQLKQMQQMQNSQQ